MKRLLLVSLILLALIGSASAVEDYEDWTYNRTVNITNPASVANYQHFFNLTWQTGMNTSFADIRFAELGGTHLDYWIENSVSGSYANVWIEVQTANQDQMYLYYGNGGAVSESSGTNIFELFDDFPGSSVNTTLWTKGGTVTVSNSEAYGTGSITSKASYGANYALRSRLKSSEYSFTTSGREPIFGFWNSANPMVATFEYSATGFALWSRTAAGATTQSQVGGGIGFPDADTYYIWEVQRNGTTSNTANIEGFGSGNCITNIPSESLHVTLQEQESYYTWTADWILVRKYQSPEPTCTLTEAPEGDPPVASFTTSKTFVRIPQSITFTDTSTETPDEWLWDFGDGTTSTDQNPVHRYTKRGKWNVTLTATNDAGSDESDATTVRVTGYETYT